MHHKFFETPIWIQNIDPKRLNLVSKNFKPNWLSETPSSFSENEEDNYMDEDGKKYLKEQILFCLQEFGIKDIDIIQIWRTFITMVIIRKNTVMLILCFHLLFMKK